MFGRKKKTKEQEQEEALAELRALPRPAMDFTTPEGAILCLEDAYRRKDIEAACACKDFLVEATLMLLEAAPDTAGDAEVRAKAAEVVELAFRKEKDSHWPDMEGTETFFIDRQEIDEGIVLVSEIMKMPDGSLCQSHLRVAHLSGKGWRVLNAVSDEDA